MRLVVILACVSIMLVGTTFAAKQQSSWNTTERRLLYTFDQVGDTLFGPQAGAFFGHATSLSSNGLRLAVGASQYDDTTISNVGSVFIFDFDGSDWIPVTSISGRVPNEEIGGRLSLSSNGAVVGVRHLREQNEVNPHYVAVYDTESGFQLGSDLTCGDYGQGVAVSPDGYRVAVSCENFGSNRGRVEIFDYNIISATWTSIGIIDGTVNQSLFGWGTVFDSTGNRIAISAPLHDADGILRTGLVRVYDYVAGAWIQVGSDIVGQATQERIGLALDMSDDGSTLVIGAPGRAGDRGFVNTFELNGGDWVQKGATVNGEDDGDQFGRSVSINADGSRWAASSSQHNDNLGQVRLFEFAVSSEWSILGDFDGAVPSENFGFGQNSVSMDSLGGRIAIGATLADDPDAGVNAGSVIVFDQDLTPSQSPSEAPVTTANPTFITSTNAPSLTPTQQFEEGPIAVLFIAPNNGVAPHFLTSSPSSPPSSVDFPSFSPSTTVPTSSPTIPISTPSSSPTLITPDPTTISPTHALIPTANNATTTGTITPTITLGKFDWDIERVGNVQVSFNEQSDREEVKLTYLISLRDYEVSILEEDCLTPVPLSVVEPFSSVEVISPTHGSLQVNLDIKQESVVGSTIWFSLGQDSGFVSLCVRVDLLNNVGDNNITAEATSVDFHEQKVFVTVDLTQEFHVENIELEREAPDEESQSVSIDYDLFACQCNETFVCIDRVLSQGSDLYLCIWSNDTNIDIVSVPTLDLRHNTTTFRIVDESIGNSLTEVSTGLLGGKLAVIRTQLISRLFENPDSTILTAWGDATIAFVSSRRSLGAGRLGTEDRFLDEETTEMAGFRTQVSVLPVIPPTLSEGPRHQSSAAKTTALTTVIAAFIVSGLF